MKPPSRKQLDYLADLGYSGAAPTSSRQASAAIDVMLKSRDVRAAERAVLKQQKAEQKRERAALKDQLAAIRQEIWFMVRENRAYGGDGLFAGFLFVEIDDKRPSETDAPYVGAFVPLAVAQQHPEILLRETIDYEDVLTEDKLPVGTRVVVAPGQLQPLRSRAGCMGLVLVTLCGIASFAA